MRRTSPDQDPPIADHGRKIPPARVDAAAAALLAERWLVAPLHHGHMDPREAGVGNVVSCGAAMRAATAGEYA